MINLKKIVRQAVIGIAAFAATTVACYAIPVTQLGFALDRSGSVGSGNWTTVRTGLAAALGAIPTDSSVEITVVAYASSAVVVVPPTVITSVADRNNVVAAVNGMAFTGGSTGTTAAINALTAALTGSANFADPNSRAIINLSTDGQPNNTTTTAQASQAARDAGIDALTAEGIANANNEALRRIVFNPQGGLGTGVILPVNSNPPNPLSAANAWVVPVSTFEAYAGVIASKVSVIVNPTPVPGTLLLMGVGLLGLCMKRRSAKV